MTKYNVHIYREMRLVYAAIEAATEEAAAHMARDWDTSDADDIQSCDGQTFAAVVDFCEEPLADGKDILFDEGRLRNHAPDLVDAIRGVLADLNTDLDMERRLILKATLEDATGLPGCNRYAPDALAPKPEDRGICIACFCQAEQHPAAA